MLSLLRLRRPLQTRALFLVKNLFYSVLEAIHSHRWAQIELGRHRPDFGLGLRCAIALIRPVSLHFGNYAVIMIVSYLQRLQFLRFFVYFWHQFCWHLLTTTRCGLWILYAMHRALDFRTGISLLRMLIVVDGCSFANDLWVISAAKAIILVQFYILIPWLARFAGNTRSLKLTWSYTEEGVPMKLLLYVA